jgi:hypothetical protein
LDRGVDQALEAPVAELGEVGGPARGAREVRDDDVGRGQVVGEPQGDARLHAGAGVRDEPKVARDIGLGAEAAAVAEVAEERDQVPDDGFGGRRRPHRHGGAAGTRRRDEPPGGGKVPAEWARRPVARQTGRQHPAGRRPHRWATGDPESAVAVDREVEGAADAHVVERRDGRIQEQVLRFERGVDAQRARRIG